MRLTLGDRNRLRAADFDDRWTPEPNTGCWLWLGYVNEDGYGKHHNPETGKQEPAHRFSWKRTNGPIPDGLYVLHRCDVPCCVNPSHLFLGTQAENVADMIAKGRQKPSIGGTKNPKVKLTEDAVRAIRADTRSQSVIGADHGIGQAQVSKIQLRQSWSHVQ